MDTSSIRSAAYDEAAKRNIHQAQIGAQQHSGLTNSVPKPTRFSNCAGMLEDRVSRLCRLVDRFTNVADRLGGAVPESDQVGQEKLRGGSSCIADQLERTLADLDQVISFAELTAERLEQL